MMQNLVWCAIAALTMLAIGALAVQTISMANVREAQPMSSEEADDLATRQWLRDYFNTRTGLI